MGVAEALGIPIDTLVVRSLLVPAIAALVGEASWWPVGRQEAPAAEPPQRRARTGERDRHAMTHRDLTPRQATVATALAELSADAHAVPYGRVADRLGIARATAYRLLRLLEAKGYAESVYAPPARVRSPGRSMVLFRPTARSMEFRAPVGAAPTERTQVGDADEEWLALRRRALAALRSGDAERIRSALTEVLAGLDASVAPFGLAGRTIAALLLALAEASLRSSGRGGEWEEPVQRMVGIGGQASLSALSGLLVGLAWTRHTSHDVADRLARRADRFEAALASLSPEGVSSLLDFVRQVEDALRHQGEPRPQPGHNSGH